MKTALVFFALILTSVSSFADDQCNWDAVIPERYTCNGQSYIKGTATCRSGIYKGVFCNEREAEKGGKDCAHDVDPDTLKCQQKLFGVADDEVEKPENQGCAGGFLAICSEGSPKSEQTVKAPDKKTKARPISPGWPQPEKQAQEVPETASKKTWGTMKSNEDRCDWEEPGASNHACEGETFLYGNLLCARRGAIPHLFCMKKHEGNVADCINDNDPKTHRCLKALTGLRPKAVANPATSAPSGAIR